MAPNTYGSISKDESFGDDSSQAVELLPAHHGRETVFIGDIDASSDTEEADSPPGRGAEQKVVTVSKSKWTKHHCISYTLAALVCLYSAHYWQNRADSYDSNNNNNNDINGPGGLNDGRRGRVPMPPALSNLDPAADLGFRSTTREGLATPSVAWGEHYYANGGSNRDESFTPLPTNQWYLNLLSHNAASDPSRAGEVAHVYTIPYILGVSPPKLPEFSSAKKDEKATVAGIELFLPVMKTGATNMQMVFQKDNGMSLGAIVTGDDNKSTSDTSSSTSSSSALTSYVVDPDVPLSPMGVNLKWNHVNMKTSIVRGMPYGTVRYGKDAKKNYVLPTFSAGNRAKSIQMDSHLNEIGKDKKMLCGSFTGKPIHQDPHHMGPLTLDGKPQTYTVQRELMFHFSQSDFTWVAFFSKPVKVQCFTDVMPAVSIPGAISEVQFALNVVEVLEDGEKNDDDELVVQMALLNECTTGHSLVREHCDHLKNSGYDGISSKKKNDQFLKALRKGAGFYSKSPLVGTEFPDEGVDGGENDSDDEGRATKIVFDWDVTSVGASLKKESSGVAISPSLRSTKKDSQNDAFIMFALPHHLETLSPSTDSESTPTSNARASPLCLHTFHGKTCIVHGSTWNMNVEHGEQQSFLANRPPAASAIPAIADALKDDMNFTLSPNVFRGAADTYFPGKIVAKMARIIVINEEIQHLQSPEDTYNYSDADDATIEESTSAAAGVTLPSEEEVESLLDDLQTAVEIWLKPGGKEDGGAEAEFLYDSTWGGFVNCGCKYEFKKDHEDEGSCGNVFPECPALDNVNEDFGNGWYNDHHFHYGYHIYAAAVVAKYRPEWAKEYYESILLYIRDIANPSPDDKYFPMFRQKDWYLGNSWAAGLMSMELSPHGREQESSSEAIAAFEGIALLGSVMMNVYADEEEEKLGSARLVRNVGELLTAMEVSAANRFWHVWNSNTDEDEGSTSVSVSDSGTPPHINAYPKEYPKPVVGMMYGTMASFQTWFGPEDVLSYGIQLIPFTSVAERRDDPEWANILYPVYAESCETADEANDGFCTANGWSIAQACLLAEATGEIEDAMEMALDIPEKVFLSLGGDGNSLSNTLWFISTRKQNQSALTEQE